MDSYFAHLRKSSGALDIILHNDNSASSSSSSSLVVAGNSNSSSRRNRSKLKRSTSSSSCPNYDAPNCPARKLSSEDLLLDGYASLHTVRTTQQRALQDFYDEVTPNNTDSRCSITNNLKVRRTTTTRTTTSSTMKKSSSSSYSSSSRSTMNNQKKKNTTSNNAKWDSPKSIDNLRNKRSKSSSSVTSSSSSSMSSDSLDRMALFEGMISEVFVLQNYDEGIINNDGDDNDNGGCTNPMETQGLIKEQLAEYLKSVEGLVAKHNNTTSSTAQPNNNKKDTRWQTTSSSSNGTRRASTGAAVKTNA